MCIRTGVESIANVDFVAYKVVEEKDGEYYNIFHSVQHITKDGIVFSLKIPEIIPERYYDYCNGCGYSLFLTFDEAQNYLYEVKQNGFIKHRKLIIIEVIVPENTRYSTGKIKEGYIGQGLRAIRAEIFKIPNKEE